MTERAAHLVEDVLPPVPVRQWVLTLPYRLRYLLAWDHSLTRAVLAVHARTLLEYYRRQAHGRGVRDGLAGTLTVTQRFGYRHSYCDSCTNMVWIGHGRAVYVAFSGKGLGECTLIPTAPAILNAIADATGARPTRLPATRERVPQALAEARG